MYSEIKSSDKILINRLDENEKILLKDMYKKGTLPSTVLGLEELTDESGEFGGVMLNFTTLDNKDIVINTDIPKSITTEVGDNYSLTIDTDIKDTTPIIYFKSNNDVAIYENDISNGISFLALKTLEEPAKLYYTISAEGYNSYNGNIDVSITPKEVQTVVFDVVNEDEEPISNFSITVTDKDNTQYIINKNEELDYYYVDLPKGTYKILVHPTDIETYSDYVNNNYEVTDEQLNNANSSVIIATLPNAN